MTMESTRKVLSHSLVYTLVYIHCSFICLPRNACCFCSLLHSFVRSLTRYGSWYECVNFIQFHPIVHLSHLLPISFFSLRCFFAFQAAGHCGDQHFLFSSLSSIFFSVPQIVIWKWWFVYKLFPCACQRLFAWAFPFVSFVFFKFTHKYFRQFRLFVFRSSICVCTMHI